MAEKADPSLFSGNTYLEVGKRDEDRHTWEALVELARAIVTLNDKHKGEGCDYASAHVTTWSDCNGVEMRHVDLTLSMPRAMVDAALAKAGVLKDDSQLAKDQEIRFSLIEME